MEVACLKKDTIVTKLDVIATKLLKKVIAMMDKNNELNETVKLSRRW